MVRQRSVMNKLRRGAGHRPPPVTGARGGYISPADLPPWCFTNSASRTFRLCEDAKASTAFASVQAHMYVTDRLTMGRRFHSWTCPALMSCTGIPARRGGLGCGGGG